jgi:putative transposase
LKGVVAEEIFNCIQVFSGKLACHVVEMNAQPEHIHLLVKISPKVSISEFMGTVKGRTVIRVFKKFSYLKQRPYWGNHFRANGYCIDTVGLDEEMIRKNVVYQERQEREQKS